MPRGKEINKEMFAQIKTLTNVGLKTKDIKKISGYGDVVVSRIRKAGSLEEYKQIVKDYNEKYSKPKVNKTEVPTFDETFTEVGGLQHLITAIEQNTKAVIALQNTLLSISKNKRGWFN